VGAVAAPLALVVLASIAGASPPVRGGADPGAVLVYYGFPSSLNFPENQFTPAKVAEDLGRYDYVVLGDEVELETLGPGDPDHYSNFGNERGHPDYPRAAAILGDPAMAATLVFGYVDLGVRQDGVAFAQNLPVDVVRRRVDLWAALGAEGIFLDDFGYDFCVTRARQNAIVDYVRSKGLVVVANAFVPADAFGAEDAPNPCGAPSNPGNVPTALDRTSYYFFESHQVREGVLESAATWQAKATALAALQQAIGFRILSITTNDAANAYDENAFFYAWYSAAMFGHAGTGWGEHLFSCCGANAGLAPLRARPAHGVGSTLTGPVVQDGATYCRATDTGAIVVDTAARAARYVPGGSCATPTTSTSSTTTSSTSSSSSSTTTLPPPEVCGNCLDDDGNGLVDLEETACCGGTGPLPMKLDKGRLQRAGDASGVRLRLKAHLGRLALEPGLDAFLQVHDVAGGATFCARVPAAEFEQIRRGLLFDGLEDDADASSTRGLELLRLKASRRGQVLLEVRGDELEMRTPVPGPVEIVLGLGHPAAAAPSDRCRGTRALFRATRTGALRFP
jgi:hypothetical protein